MLSSTTVRWTCVGLTLLLAAVACEDDVVFDDDGTGGSSSHTLDNVCDTIPQRVCQSRELCCEDVGHGYDETTCIERQRQDCEANVDAVNDGNIAFDPSTIDACLDLVDDLSTECFRGLTDTFSLLDELLDTCGDIFRGTKEEGDPCTLDAECAVPDNGSAGCSEDTDLCVQIRIRDADQSCSFADGDYCGDGLYCDLPMGPMQSGTCQPALDLGDTCDPIMAPLECGLGFYCDGATMECTEGKGEGEVCAFGAECASFDCDNNRCGALDPTVDEEACGQ